MPINVTTETMVARIGKYSASREVHEDQVARAVERF